MIDDLGPIYINNLIKDLDHKCLFNKDFFDNFSIKLKVLIGGS